MKQKILPFLAVIFFSVFALANNAYQEILDNAGVGNGGTEIKKYDTNTFDLQKEINETRKSLAQLAGEECVDPRPSAMTHDRRESIKRMNEFTGDDFVTNKLTDFYKQKQIFKMITVRTTYRVECTSLLVRVFMLDGTLLEIFYGLGD